MENSGSKYRFNTILNVYDIGDNSISDVAVIYVKLDKDLDYSAYVDNVKNNLSITNNGQVSFEGNYIGKTYSTSDVTLTNKNRLQFTLNLTEEQINNNYSNVLAFTAFKYGDTWKISDNCVAYQNGVPTTVLMWNINE